MRVALVNPAWDFSGSIYFGCRAPHLPLELGYAARALEDRGHVVLLADGLIEDRSNAELADAVRAFGAAMTIVTTAPSYLFWRCAPPELRSPRSFVSALAGGGGQVVAVGPHGSVTPGAVLRKLGADIVAMGECDEIVAEIADANGPVDGTAIPDGDEIRVLGKPRAARFTDAPALTWPRAWVARHDHHHHRFGTPSSGLGAEVEASRGCPYSCTFCAKSDYRDRYRRRSLAPLLEEIDALIGQGVGYLYFIDEIFLPDRALLTALSQRGVEFGMQTRIDLWKSDMLALLGAAGCVSIEAGVESLTEGGRAALDKSCRMSTQMLADRLVEARRHVPFVQANLIATERDEADLVGRWREQLQAGGVWANDPVPMFPYPSSPDYHRRFGPPDDVAWERAHEYYLSQFGRMSEIQEERPLPLPLLEAVC